MTTPSGLPVSAKDHIEHEIEEVESRLAALGPPARLDFHANIYRGSMLNLREDLYATLEAIEKETGHECD